MSVCYLNGEFLNLKDAKISPLDRGFLFGDSIYEVFAAYDKKAFKIEEHLDRFFVHLNILIHKVPSMRPPPALQNQV